MPTTNRFVTPTHDFLPVGAASTFRNIGPNLHDPHGIIPTESVVVHHDDIQVQLIGVHVIYIELKRFFVDGRQSVLLDGGFPLLHALAFVIEGHLHIGICGNDNNNTVKNIAREISVRM